MEEQLSEMKPNYGSTHKPARPSLRRQRHRVGGVPGRLRRPLADRQPGQRLRGLPDGGGAEEDMGARKHSRQLERRPARFPRRRDQALRAGGSGCIQPPRQTILDGTYSPLSRPLFVYVRKDSLDRTEVAEFMRFYLTEGPELVAQVGYVGAPGAGD